MVTSRAQRVSSFARVPAFEATEGLQFRVGSDLLVEFVAGHTYADVVRELVQNEYDAGGSRLRVHFGADALTVTGNGQTIDAAGWRRLSVMLSTGHVAGGRAGDEPIEAKVNSIGSKNAGLRTLFLIGERITIQSGGQATVMDRTRGTYPKPRPDPETVGRHGVQITVPYRMADSGALRRFSEDAESAALDAFAVGLGGVLPKLSAPPGQGRLREIEVISERHGRSLTWRLLSEELKTRATSTTAVRRSVRSADTVGDAAASRRVTDEMEFFRRVTPPGGIERPRIPGYYRSPGGRIALGVSLALRRGRPDPDAAGLCFYPLAASGSVTGNGISINAPFWMNQDRSAIIEHPWNDWLLDEAARLALDLLASDWYGRFGSGGFLACCKGAPAPMDRFAAAVERGLREIPIWPSRATEGRGRRSRLVRAGDLVLPASASLDGYITADERALAPDLAADQALVAMVRGHGAMSFTLNSLVRLRSSGADPASRAETPKVEGEADFHYSAGAAVFAGTSGAELQHRMASSIEAEARHLTRANRTDLLDQSATLAADGSLGAAKDLWFVPAAIVGAEHLPPSLRLHPILSDSKTLRGMCRRFDASAWVRDVAERAKAGTCSETERAGVHAYVLSTHGRLSAPVLAAVREAPLMRDHRGEWVAAIELTSPNAPFAKLLGPVLHFPSDELRKDPALLARLRIRKAVSDADFLAFAEGHVSTVEAAAKLEAALARHPRLSKSLAEGLSRCAILRDRSGRLRPPRDLYLDSHVTRAAVGPAGAFVAGSRPDLYRRLGCLEEPDAAAILANLVRLRASGLPVSEPDLVYPALVQALTRERSALDAHATELIVHTESGWSSPRDTLVGMRFPKALNSLPHVRTPETVATALQRLGASSAAEARHWISVFETLASRYPEGRGPVSAADRALLLEIYRSRGREGVPGGLGASVPILLTRDSQLASLDDVRRRRVVRDDFPSLSAAMEAAGVRIAFALDDEPARDFVHALDLPSLRFIAGSPAVRLGAEMAPQQSLKPHVVIAKLHDKAFASACAAVAHQVRPGHADWDAPMTGELRRRLERVIDVVPVESLSMTFRFGRERATVAGDWWVDGGRIALVRPRSRSRVYDLLAQAVAAVITGTPADDPGLRDSVFRLLTMDDAADIQEYLGSRGMRWTAPGTQAEPHRESEDEEHDGDRIAAALSEATLGLTRAASTIEPAGAPPAASNHPPRAPREPKEALPPVDEVAATVRKPSSSWTPPERATGPRRGHSSAWTAPTAEDADRAREVGRRAEELVFGAEQGAAVERGLDPARVVWVADVDPAADHDIRSIDAAGNEILIEVKGTEGRDGHFRWPQAEFARAVQARGSYVLARVYLVGSTDPVIKMIDDPIGRMLDGRLRIDVAELSAEVEPLDAPGTE